MALSVNDAATAGALRDPAVNATLFVRRLRGALARIPAIQRYYEQCINHKIMPFDLPPRP
ncbi:hypothetical protein O0544_09340 [Edwardsiella anguillarum]|nr:hypothetical protein [Edwardsiella anguillarum]